MVYCSPAYTFERPATLGARAIAFAIEQLGLINDLGIDDVSLTDVEGSAGYSAATAT